MGLHIASSNEGGWERLVIATFILIILSPFDLKLIKDEEIEKLLELIESEYGDKFIRADNLKLISERSNSVDKAVQWMIRNDFLQEEKNGKYFFKNHMLKSFKVDLFKSIRVS